MLNCEASIIFPICPACPVECSPREIQGVFPWGGVYSSGVNPEDGLGSTPHCPVECLTHEIQKVFFWCGVKELTKLKRKL